MEEDSEAIWIQIQLCKTNFLVRCVYRAPNESLEGFDYLDDLLRYATRKNVEVIILGDLNCDYLNDSLDKTKRLLEFLAANELEQIIKEPTRVTCNTRSLIDLLVTSTPSLFRSSGILSTTISDLYPIFGLMNGPAICPHKHRILTTRTWSDESRKNFIDDLKKTPWTFLEFFDDMEDMYSAWECLFKSLIDFPLSYEKEKTPKANAPMVRQLCATNDENPGQGA